ncbi:hypothetical protein DFA_06873 [Cavenderia fasciculata]|uniref:Protein kinase domain-containing protein n=1 Tax=Cavenderia fasciculata TaxID=261658 RepID=F4PWX0_CACFS|nr:uncharacterized protein DFA_06873 [Cavenderia fasciculata]EGG19773.1 hypothetical protein DFA_06873 [Cavenderia fasciculata]|eukprot:XP_004358119.1 hypothetical protein DFA_06873 [Cavenderia fasciculata]
MTTATIDSLVWVDNQPISVGVLPSSLQSLRFGGRYNQPLSVGVLPSSLQSLVFGKEYNQPIPVGVLPTSLQSLVFGRDYNQALSVGVLPSSLQSLEFGWDYDQPLSVGVLPTSLQSLVFGYYYDQPLSVGVLPSSLQSLEFGWYYNQPLSVGVLPSSLQSLVFGYYYDQPLSVGVLPSSLQSLEFGNIFNQPLSVGVLPSSLQSLEFGWYYNQPLSVGVLPSSLQSLVFGYYYNQPLSVGVLPSSLQSLVFGYYYDQPLSVGVLPSSLQSLVFGWYYNQRLSVGVLPSSLQSLRFGGRYNQPLSVGVLPTSLQSLVFGNIFNQPLSVGVLPSSLQSLVFGWYYNQRLSVGVLPSSLQSLVFGRDYNQPLSVGVLPSSLQSLEFGYYYDQPLSVGVLPSSLQSLVFGNEYNQAISVGVLPPSLQSLVFGDEYNQPLSVGVLPSSLQSLVFGYYYDQPLSVGVLPSSLQSLGFGNEYNQAISVGVLPTSLQSLVFGRNLADSAIRYICSFDQSIGISKGFVKYPSIGVIKLPFNHNKTLIFAHQSIDAPTPFESIDCHPHLFRPPPIVEGDDPHNGTNIDDDSKQQKSTSLNTNPNSINYSTKYLMTYPIDQSSFVTVNSNKYFKLHSFPYSANKVFLVMSESYNELLVYKEIDYSLNQSIYDKIQFEITTMKLFIGDEMFVQYKDHQDDTESKKIYLLTHYCEGGDLEQLFQSIYKWNESQKATLYPKYKYILESEIWRYIRRLFLILEKLSQHNLAHLDIKPLNLFIGSDGEIVLGDFGCCQYFIDQPILSPDIGKTCDTHPERMDDQTKSQDTNIMMAIATTLASRGTNGYYSPESKHKKYYSSNDIYSVGSTLFHLLSCHPVDIENRKQFILNHKKNNFDADHIKISTDRYTEHLIDFVKKLLIATPQNRLSLDDLTGEIVNQHTQRITSFLINQQQILSSTTTLILDGEFNSPLNGLLPPILLKLKLFGKFNQPIKEDDIPFGVKTLIFGSSFNCKIEYLPRSLNKLVLGKSFNWPVLSKIPNTCILDLTIDSSCVSSEIIRDLERKYLEEQKSVNTYHLSGIPNIADSFINENIKYNSILTIGENCYGSGKTNIKNKMVSWKNNDIEISIDLTDVGVISNVQASIHPHLYCQIDKLKFEALNKQLDFKAAIEYPLPNMAKLFELDEDNLHQVYQDDQYLNIRFIPLKPTMQE